MHGVVNRKMPSINGEIVAKLDKYRYPWPWRDRMDERMKTPGSSVKVDWNKEMAEEQAAMQELDDASDALKGDAIVGAVLRWGRGDGYAVYIVTKEKPLTLAWVPYSDAWAVEDALIRGLTKKDIYAMLRPRTEVEIVNNGKSRLVTVSYGDSALVDHVRVDILVGTEWEEVL